MSVFTMFAVLLVTNGVPLKLTNHTAKVKLGLPPPIVVTQRIFRAKGREL